MGTFYQKEKAFACKLWDIIMLLWQCIGAPFVIMRYTEDNLSILLAISSFITFHIWLIVGKQMWERKLSGSALYEVVAFGIEDLIGTRSSLYDKPKISEETKGSGGPIFYLLQIIIYLSGLSLWFYSIGISFGDPFSETFWKLVCLIITIIYTAAMCEAWLVLILKLDKD